MRVVLVVFVALGVCCVFFFLVFGVLVVFVVFVAFVVLAVFVVRVVFVVVWCACCV